MPPNPPSSLHSLWCGWQEDEKREGCNKERKKHTHTRGKRYKEAATRTGRKRSGERARARPDFSGPVRVAQSMMGARERVPARPTLFRYRVCVCVCVSIPKGACLHLPGAGAAIATARPARARTKRRHPSERPGPGGGAAQRSTGATQNHTGRWPLLPFEPFAKPSLAAIMCNSTHPRCAAVRRGLIFITSFVCARSLSLVGSVFRTLRGEGFCPCAFACTVKTGQR